MNKQNKPELVVRDGSLKATVWRNESDKGLYFTTTFARTYSDAQGNPKDTQSFSQTDLLRLAELGRETYGVINDLKREQSQSQRVENEPDQHQDDASEREAFKDQRRQQNGQSQQQTPRR